MAEFEMPVDIIMPQPPVVEAPGEYIPTPEELFAAHVGAVRQTGDAFDERTDLKVSRALPLGIAPAAVVSLVSAEHFNFTDGVKGLAVVVIATAATGAGSSKTTKGTKEAAKAKYNEEAQEANDARYELYRTNRREDGTYNVAMHWLGNMRNEDGNTNNEELTRVAELAKANDISELVVSSKLAADFCMYLDDGHDTNVDEWLKKNKGVEVSRKTLANAYTATPDEWIAAAAQKPPTYRYEQRENPLKQMGYLSANHAGLGVLLPKDTVTGFVEAGNDPLAYEKGEPVTVAVPVRHPMAVQRVYSIQADKAAGLLPADMLVTLNRRKHTVAAFGAGLALASTLFFGEAVLDNQLEQRAEEATIQITDEAGVRPEDRHRVTVDPQAVRDRVNSWSWVNRSWSGWVDARTSMHEFLQTDDEAATPGKSTADTGSGIGGGVGNVNNISLAPVWSLIPHNLPDSALAGHWSVDTASILEATAGKDGVPVLAWNQHTIKEADGRVHSDTEDGTVLELPATLPENPTQESIEASGTVDNANAQGVIALPALEGYALRAANVNGEPAYALRKTDGTYVLTLGPSIEATDKINYWLTPNKNRRVKSSDGFWLVPESGTAGDDIIDYPGLHKALSIGEGDKRLSASEFVTYSHDNFTYLYAPWSEKEIAKQKAVSGIVSMTMAEKKAQCNLAGTLLMLSDPTDKSPVFEYSNKTEVRSLSGNEAHMRVVTTSGETYDATPTLPAIIKPEKPDTPDSAPVSPLVAIGALVVGGFALTQRRRIKSAVRSSVAGLVERSAGNTLRAAVTATEHAVWGSPDTQISSAQLEAAKANKAMTAQQAIRTLEEPGRHSADVVAHVGRQKAVTSMQRLAVKFAAHRATSATAKAENTARKAHVARHRAS